MCAFPQLFLVLTLCAVFWVSFLHNRFISDIWLTVHLNVYYSYFISLCCLAVGQKGSGNHLLHFAIFGYDMVSDRLSIILKNIYICIYIYKICFRLKKKIFLISLLKCLSYSDFSFIVYVNRLHVKVGF